MRSSTAPAGRSGSPRSARSRTCRRHGHGREPEPAPILTARELPDRITRFYYYRFFVENLQLGTTPTPRSRPDRGQQHPKRILYVYHYMSNPAADDSDAPSGCPVNANPNSTVLKP